MARPQQLHNLGAEDTKLILSAPLGSLERLIGMTNHDIRLRAVLGIDTDAEGASEVEVLAFNEVRLR